MKKQSAHKQSIKKENAAISSVNVVTSYAEKELKIERWLDRSETKITQNTTRKAVTIRSVIFEYLTTSNLLNPFSFFSLQGHSQSWTVYVFHAHFPNPTHYVTCFLLLGRFFPSLLLFMFYSIKGKLNSANTSFAAVIFAASQGTLRETAGPGRGPRSESSPG